MTKVSKDVHFDRGQAVLRLTALWAVVESGLGGVLHAFKLPFTGLIVGGTAIILITLIAQYARHPRQILEATLLVLVVKALVSPHAPIGAYIAVSFQGLLGYALYSLGKPNLLTATVFAVLAMLESALQKLLMLWLFFGNPLWEAVDTWGAYVAKKYLVGLVGSELSASSLLIGGYVGVYALGGLFIGWLAARMYKEVEAVMLEVAQVETLPEDLPGRPATGTQRSSRKRRKLLTWLLIGGALGLSLYFSETQQASLKAGAYLLRTLAIVCAWYFVVGPVLAGLFRKWLLGKKSRYARQVDDIFDLLPRLKLLSKARFQHLRGSYSGLRLYRRWLIEVLAVSLSRSSSRTPSAKPSPLSALSQTALALPDESSS